MKKLTVNNVTIELERKKIKNMYLRILPPDGRIAVSAPMRMSEEEIKDFVKSKILWIRKHQNKIMQKQEALPKNINYTTGDKVTIWGITYDLIISSNPSQAKVMQTENELILNIKSDSTAAQREALLNKYYRRLLEQELPFYIRKWESIIGVEVNSWNIRNMKTRWGSCHVLKKNICFNLQLAKKPKECLEYVVVHELVHLLEKSHNHIFKSYMDSFLPEWREIKRRLNS